MGAIHAISSWYGRKNTPIELGSEDDQRWPDYKANKTVYELIKAKMSGLYIMAGDFANPDHPGTTSDSILKASKYISENWPTPVVYSGFEIGGSVITGGAMTNPEENLVTQAYELFPAGGIGKVLSATIKQFFIMQCVVIKGAMFISGRLVNQVQPPF